MSLNIIYKNYCKNVFAVIIFNNTRDPSPTNVGFGIRENYMTERKYDEEAVLSHIQNLFDEMEESMAMSHQEKYTLLEDVFENASDTDELRVAFDQWYADHADDLGLEYDADELWDQSLSGGIDFDKYDSKEEGLLEEIDEEEKEKEDDYFGGKDKDDM